MIRRHSVAVQLLAVTLCLGIARYSIGKPGDIMQSAAPVLGAEAPKSLTLDAGDASVSPQTGAFTYGFPIAVAPGRAGMQPSLSLGYSSQAPLYGGLAAGWTFEVPTIRRDWSGGHYAPERWTSSLAGGRELIPVDEVIPADADQAFRAQADSSYARYQRLSQTGEYKFRVLTTDGITH